MTFRDFRFKDAGDRPVRRKVACHDGRTSTVDARCLRAGCASHNGYRNPDALVKLDDYGAGSTRNNAPSSSSGSTERNSRRMAGMRLRGSPIVRTTMKLLRNAFGQEFWGNGM